MSTSRGDSVPSRQRLLHLSRFLACPSSCFVVCSRTKAAPLNENCALFEFKSKGAAALWACIDLIEGDYHPRHLAPAVTVFCTMVPAKEVPKGAEEDGTPVVALDVAAQERSQKRRQQHSKEQSKKQKKGVSEKTKKKQPKPGMKNPKKEDPEKKPNKKKEKLAPNQTHTTVKVSLAKHCTSEGMRELISKCSLFVSQSANCAGNAMNYFILSRNGTQDEALRHEFDEVFEKSPLTKDSFSYACMNSLVEEKGGKQVAKSHVRKVVPYPFEVCDHNELDMEGQGALYNAQARLMRTNIEQHLLNWSIYQRRAVTAEIYQGFGLDMKGMADRSRAKMLCRIAIQQINGTMPDEELENDNVAGVLEIVLRHREALGMGSYQGCRVGESSGEAPG